MLKLFQKKKSLDPGVLSDDAASKAAAAIRESDVNGQEPLNAPDLHTTPAPSPLEVVESDDNDDAGPLENPRIPKRNSRASSMTTLRPRHSSFFTSEEKTPGSPRQAVRPLQKKATGESSGSEEGANANESEVGAAGAGAGAATGKRRWGRVGAGGANSSKTGNTTISLLNRWRVNSANVASVSRDNKKEIQIRQAALSDDGGSPTSPRRKKEAFTTNGKSENAETPFTRKDSKPATQSASTTTTATAAAAAPSPSPTTATPKAKAAPTAASKRGPSFARLPPRSPSKTEGGEHARPPRRGSVQRDPSQMAAFASTKSSNASVATSQTTSQTNTSPSTSDRGIEPPSPPSSPATVASPRKKSFDSSHPKVPPGGTEKEASLKRTRADTLVPRLPQVGGREWPPSGASGPGQGFNLGSEACTFARLRRAKTGIVDQEFTGFNFTPQSARERPTPSELDHSSKSGSTSVRGNSPPEWTSHRSVACPGFGAKEAEQELRRALELRRISSQLP